MFAWLARFAQSGLQPLADPDIHAVADLEPLECLLAMLLVLLHEALRADLLAERHDRL